LKKENLKKSKFYLSWYLFNLVSNLVIYYTTSY